MLRILTYAIGFVKYLIVRMLDALARNQPTYLIGFEKGASRVSLKRLDLLSFPCPLSRIPKAFTAAGLASLSAARSVLAVVAV